MSCAILREDQVHGVKEERVYRWRPVGEYAACQPGL